MEHDLFVRDERRIQIQGIGGIEVVVLIRRFGRRTRFGDTNGCERLIGVEGATFVHHADLNQTLRSISDTVDRLVMITRTNLELERTVRSLAYTREDDISAVETILGVHQQSTVLGTAVTDGVGDILTAMRVVEERLCLCAHTVSAGSQSRMDIVVVTLGVDTTCPSFRCLAGIILKAEEVGVVIVIQGVHLERITRPRTDIIVLAKGASIDIIRGSRQQVIELDMRRFYDDTCGCIQISGNITDERYLRLGQDH